VRHGEFHSAIDRQPSPSGKSNDREGKKMPTSMEKLFSYVVEKIHPKDRASDHAHDFEDTWTRVTTDYGDLWERKRTRAESEADSRAVSPPR
jgi:hypothetical protein